MSKEEEFELIFECRCQCGDEDLEWSWSPDELRFEAECSCLKRHCLVPKSAVVQFDIDNTESDEDEDWN